MDSESSHSSLWQESPESQEGGEEGITELHQELQLAEPLYQSCYDVHHELGSYRMSSLVEKKQWKVEKLPRGVHGKQPHKQLAQERVRQY